MLCVHSAFGDQCPPSVIIAGNSELSNNLFLLEPSVDTQSMIGIRRAFEGDIRLMNNDIDTNQGSLLLMVGDDDIIDSVNLFARCSSFQLRQFLGNNIADLLACGAVAIGIVGLGHLFVLVRVV